MFYRLGLHTAARGSRCWVSRTERRCLKVHDWRLRDSVPIRRLWGTRERFRCGGRGRTFLRVVSEVALNCKIVEDVPYPLQLSHLNGRRSSCRQKGIWQWAPIASTSPVDILLNDSSGPVLLGVLLREVMVGDTWERVI